MLLRVIRNKFLGKEKKKIRIISLFLGACSNKSFITTTI
ncbi:hypothetical protein PUN28_019208 [Cardiocondyla obscurior]|uniref:Lipoprotein n=1 Tax=Cardiocondyla obscurior TaxID=286306 RepID=A0AAW2EAE9_9HYME